MSEGAEDRLQSVGRAIQVLEIIAEDGEMGVTDLAQRLGVHKATASRLAGTLAARGLIERDRATGRYRLGFGLIRLAGAVMADLDLVRVARPILEDLAHETRETVNLGVPAGDAVVYVDQVSGARSVVSVNWVGRRTPLHCTSNGKVLLAFASASDRDRLLGRTLERLTPRTIVDPVRLRRGTGGRPPARLRADAGGVGGGLERGGGAHPPGRRRARGGAVGLGAGVPDDGARPAPHRSGRDPRGRRGLAPAGVPSAHALTRADPGANLGAAGRTTVEGRSRR